MASSRKQATNADKKEPSYIVGGNVNCTTTMKNSMESPQTTKNKIAT
jgi:thiamine monophosphate synthase